MKDAMKALLIHIQAAYVVISVKNGIILNVPEIVKMTLSITVRILSVDGFATPLEQKHALTVTLAFIINQKSHVFIATMCIIWYVLVYQKVVCLQNMILKPGSVESVCPRFFLSMMLIKKL